MSTPAALMGAGTVLSIFGQYAANMDRAQAEARNADFYAKEASYTREAEFRQAQITQQNYTYKLSQQGSAAARGGVDVGSGSILQSLAQTSANEVQELAAVKRKGDLDFELASSRSQEAQQVSDTLSSNSYNLMQAGGTALTGYARMSASK